MEIQVVKDGQLNEVDRKGVLDLIYLAFHEEWEKDTLVWTENSDWDVLIKLEDRVVSHVGILERMCLVAGEPVKLGGIGTVATLPEFWHRGLGSAAMRRANEFMREEMKVDFGLLVCAPGTVPFYQGLGWRVVPGPLHFDQPGGKFTEYPDVTMVLPCVKTDFPAGIIDLCGLPW